MAKKLTPAQRLAIAKKQHAKELKEALTERKMELEITKLTSPTQINRELSMATTSKLNATIDAIEDINPDVVIRRVFGFGIQVDKLLTIARTIQYSKAEYKQDMLAMLNLDEQTIEDCADSIGQTQYFNPKSMEMIDEIFPDLDELKENITLIGSDMGMTIDVTKVKKKKIEAIYKSSKAKAIELEKTTREHMALEDDSIIYED